MVSGVPVYVEIPKGWKIDTLRGWELRGAQVKALLSEKCRKDFGPGFLHEADGEFRWLRGHQSESFPDLVQLNA